MEYKWSKLETHTDTRNPNELVCKYSRNIPVLRPCYFFSDEESGRPTPVKYCWLRSWDITASEDIDGPCASGTTTVCTVRQAVNRACQSKPDQCERDGHINKQLTVIYRYMKYRDAGKTRYIASAEQINSNL